MRRTRKSVLRKPKKLIIVVCEGKTEINYFEGLFYSNPENRDFYSFKSYQPSDYSPLGIIKQCIFEIDNALTNKIKLSDISIWAIFDRDQHANLDTSFQKAKSRDIKIIFSSICFEYWILLHYARTTRPFHNCSEIITFIKSSYDNEYEKRNNHYNNLKDRINTAIENGNWLIEQVLKVNADKQIYEMNPYTNAHELASYLLEI
jgi:hypothetical protein